MNKLDEKYIIFLFKSENGRNEGNIDFNINYDKFKELEEEDLVDLIYNLEDLINKCKETIIT